MPRKAKPANEAAADKASGSSKVARAPRLKKGNVEDQASDVIWNREVDEMIISKLNSADRKVFRQAGRAARRAVNAYISRVHTEETSVLNLVGNSMYPNVKELHYLCLFPPAVTKYERNQMDEALCQIATRFSGALEALTITTYGTAIGMKPLTTAPAWPVLDSLSLVGIDVSTADIKSLGRLDMPSLKTLDLSGNGFGVPGVKALAKASWVAQLGDLDLSYYSLNDDGMSHVAALSVPHLRALNIDGNGLSYDGVLNLATATNMGYLRELSLQENEDIYRYEHVQPARMHWLNLDVQYTRKKRGGCDCSICGGGDDYSYSGW